MTHLVESTEAIIDGVLQREGCYVDNADDRGGATNWGITEAVARAFGYTGSMRDLPRERAREIYRTRYWAQPKFDQLHDVSPVIAEKLMDIGVNMGPATGVKFLQRALNALNSKGTLYPDMAIDGGLGAISLHALRTFLAKRGKSGETVLWRMVNAQQSVRYLELAEANQSQETFEFGWQANRVGGFA